MNMFVTLIILNYLLMLLLQRLSFLEFPQGSLSQLAATRSEGNMNKTFLVYLLLNRIALIGAPVFLVVGFQFKGFQVIDAARFIEDIEDLYHVSTANTPGNIDWVVILFSA